METSPCEDRLFGGHGGNQKGLSGFNLDRFPHCLKAVLGRRPRPGSLQPALRKGLRDRTAPLITPLPPLLLRPFTALSPLATRHLTPFNNRPHVERAHFARCCVNMRPLPETSSPDKAEAKLLCSTFSEGAVKAWQRYPRPTSLMAARHMAAVRWLSSFEAHRTKTVDIAG